MAYPQFRNIDLLLHAIEFKFSQKAYNDGEDRPLMALRSNLYQIKDQAANLYARGEDAQQFQELDNQIGENIREGLPSDLVRVPTYFSQSTDDITPDCRLNLDVVDIRVLQGALTLG